MNVIRQIEAMVQVHGDRLCFSSRSGSMCYDEMWRDAGKLAHWLDGILGDNRDPVVVYGHKDPLILVCFLACARTGRAYCPVDTNMPPERVGEIIQMVANPVVLTTETLHAGVSTNSRVMTPTAIKAVLAEQSAAAYRNHYDPSANHYIIFTSGSTGKPKGVMITGDNLGHYLDWIVGIGGDATAAPQVYLNQAPFSFDLSVMDLYRSLVTGGTLWCVDKALQQDVPEMLTYIQTGQINTWVSTPSFADVCLSEADFDSAHFPSIDLFLFCGETLHKATAAKLLTRFPAAQVFNTYGPTETTVCVTAVPVTKNMTNAEGALPIGVPKPDLAVRIVAEDGSLAAPGDKGEMTIVGDTVSPGYYKNPEKTAAAFFTTTLNGRPVRGYRTGDVGYYGPDGLLYYEGRIDQQIKWHGYRIELGDIESNLTKLDGVAKAAVVPNRSGDQIKHLAAFVIREAVAHPEQKCAAFEKAPGGWTLTDGYAGRKWVRAGLKQIVPNYMVPKQVIFVDHFPLSQNGKIDKKQLAQSL